MVFSLISGIIFVKENECTLLDEFETLEVSFVAMVLLMAHFLPRSLSY